MFKKDFFKILPDAPGAEIEGIEMAKIVGSNNLSVFNHNGFWHSMDTYR